MLKRIMKMAVCAGMLCVLFSGCGQAKPAAEKEDLRIICTGFAEYDWTKALTRGAQHVQLSCLLEDGNDLHSFQPTVKDMAAVSGCDIFIYGGGESDLWVQEMLDSMEHKDMTVLALMQTPGFVPLRETRMPGMQEEAEEDAYDEHVWLSLKNAELFCGRITEILEERDPSQADLYRANHDAYVRKLQELDEAYAIAAETAASDTLLVADRFPFRYLLADYGLKAYAAFAGCSSETAASFRTIVFLSETADALGLKNIVVLKNSDTRLAETVLENCADPERGIVVMDSMQNVRIRGESAPPAYLSVMETNLQALTEALALKQE